MAETTGLLNRQAGKLLHGFESRPLREIERNPCKLTFAGVSISGVPSNGKKGKNLGQTPICRAWMPSATPFPIAVRPLQHTFQKRTDEKHRPTPSVLPARGSAGRRKTIARHAGNPRHPDHPGRHTRRRRPHHPCHRRRNAYAAANRAGRGERQSLG